MSGLEGPCHKPHKIIFSPLNRICGGRLCIIKYTGQRVDSVDLNIGIPSVEMPRARNLFDHCFLVLHHSRCHPQYCYLYVVHVLLVYPNDLHPCMNIQLI